jgi:hypothetical protein
MKDGGPAFPMSGTEDRNGNVTYPEHGMTLRDYFAANCQEDDRLVKCIRAMDDTALAMFALHPDSERDEWITETESTNYLGLSEVEKIVKRLEIEAQAISRVRYMQADAMLKERDK